MLHLSTTDPDLETARDIRALAANASPAFATTTRTIGARGDYPHLLWAVLGLRRGNGGRGPGFDVVHAWDETSLAAALLAGAARVVFSVPAGPWIRSPLRAAAMRRGVRFVCSTPSQQRGCVAGGVPPERCHLVRPALGVATMSTAHERGTMRKGLGLADDEFIMLAPGESTRAADHERAAWAGSILHVVDERYRVLLWGRGRRLDAAATLGHKLRQPRLVVVAGRGRNVEFEDLLPAADAMLVTARGPVPTLPVAMAMAAGVPVVAVPRPELADVLVDNVTAFTVPSPAPRLIAQRVLDVRANPAATRDVAARASEHVRELFSPDRFGKQVEQVYQHAIARQRPSLAEAAAVSGLSTP